MTNSAYVGLIQLICDLGNAKGFIKTEPDNSKLTIEPSDVHVGDYKVKMTLSDQTESFEKTMNLKINGP